MSNIDAVLEKLPDVKEKLASIDTELRRQKENRKDIIADTRKTEMVVNSDGELRYQVQLENNIEEFGFSSHTHSQISARLKIPKKYYDRMVTDTPDLLANNVNHWLIHEPELRMIRTLDGNVRAFLSNHYRRMDNLQLMDQLRPTFEDLSRENELKIVSCNLSEGKFYLKAIFPDIIAEPKHLDVVASGICISNSEIGLSNIWVDPFLLWFGCANMQRMTKYGMKRMHRGVAESAGEDRSRIFLTDETLRQKDKALWMEVKDMVKGCANKLVFDQMCGELSLATLDKIYDPTKVVEVLSDTYLLSDVETTEIQTSLIVSKDFTRYGLMNAVTNASQKVENYDRQSELEAIGGEIACLNKSGWDKFI